jgi:hypothetical protein
MGMRELNEKLSAITRVVLHPKYRTIGLGARLVRETLGLAGTPFIEMPAVMAKYNPFAEKAGMKKIIEQPPATEAIKITERLEELGFNKEQVASERYILSKLEAMRSQDVGKVRDAFIKYRHPRFLKNFSYDLPFGTKEAYEEKVINANLPGLTHLIKICGFLLQTKVYLFWRRP